MSGLNHVGIRKMLAALTAAVLTAIFISVTAVANPANDLAAKAKIRRDKYGVPHILAETEEAAAFAHGYAVAEDHFDELTKVLVYARGEAASVIGKQFANSDFFVLRMGTYDIARDKFDTLPPLTQAILNAYAAGYNLYLEKNRAVAPEWAKPVTGIDILARCRAAMLLAFGVIAPQMYEKALRQPTSPASTMIAVGRGRSATKRGLLLANPHMIWEGESLLMHEVHLTVPGRINVSGAAIIGTPVVAMGFNEHLGWAMTASDARETDSVYELTPDPKDPTRYLYDGGSIPFTKKRISIRVKTDSGLETVTREYPWSHFGPVFESGGKTYAYKSPNLELVNFVTQYNLMAKARSLDEFRTALNMQQIPMFHISVTDREGNLYFLYNNRVPIRPKGYDWKKPLPGNTSAAEWHAVHPISELPQVLNPKTGYIQNCNDPAWFANPEERIDRTKFAPYLANGSVRLRTQRVLQMIEEDKEITLDDLMRMKFDSRVVLADRLKTDLVALARSRKADGVDLSAAAQVLESWNNQVSPTSKGAVLFLSWWNEYKRSASPQFKAGWNEKEPLTTPYGIGDADRAVDALGKSIALLTKEYGSIDVPWGDVFRVRRGTTLDLPAPGFPMDGGALSAIDYKLSADRKWAADNGDSYILAVEFTDSPTAYSLISYSQSSVRKSTHFADQTELFVKGQWKRAWFAEEDIQKNLERAYSPGQ